jgi:hypothetical protein
MGFNEAQTAALQSAWAEHKQWGSVGPAKKQELENLGLKPRQCSDWFYSQRKKAGLIQSRAPAAGAAQSLASSRQSARPQPRGGSRSQRTLGLAKGVVSSINKFVIFHLWGVPVTMLQALVNLQWLVQYIIDVFCKVSIMRPAARQH